MRNETTNKVLSVILIVILSFVYSNQVLGNKEAPIEEDKTQYIENYDLETLDGEEVQMKDYKGKKLMLFFYETGCPYCIEGIPEVEALDLEELDMNVLMINMTEMEESIDKVKEVKEDLNMKNTIILDKGNKLTQDFNITGTPTHIFIDEEGLILGGVPGLMDTQGIIDIVEGFE